MDQALYAKAAEIIWKEDRFKNIVLRMGTIHIICNALSILGKRFGDGGLKYILIVSQIIVEGSINGVIDGRHYNRAVRAHKCVYEAMMRLVWSEFMESLESKNQEERTAVASFLEQVNAMSNDLSQDSFDCLFESSSIAKVLAMWEEFLNHHRHHNGDLCAFWMSYLEYVETIVLGLLVPHEKEIGIHIYKP